MNFDWLFNIFNPGPNVWEHKYNEEVALLNSMKIENCNLGDQIKGLQKTIQDMEINQAYTDSSPKPDWLDWTQIPYKPMVECEGGSVILLPEEIYMDSPALRDIASQWRTMNHDDKLMKIWEYVVKRLTYKYDANENWQPSAITIARGYGDCEDGTILFVTMCRLAHVPADSVFNACGYYSDSSGKYGHSFPIAKMTDGKWYIFESTLDFLPPLPKPMKGSNYDGSWGFANWKFAGKGPNQV